MNKIKELFKWNYLDFFMAFIGIFIVSFSVNRFIVPNNLYNGGLLGICQLIRSILINNIGLNIKFDFSGILYYIINIPLFILACKGRSKSFLSRTLFIITLQSIMLSIIPIPSIPSIDDIFVNVCMGGILIGIGTGIILSCGASTGGSDIIGLILTKKDSNLSVGKLSLVINLFVYSISGILYGIPTMIYSIIYSFIYSIATDKTHFQNIETQTFIFSKKNPKIINNYIKNELKRSFTYWNAYGGYDNSKTYITYVVLSKYELMKLEKYVKNIDDNIFIVKNENILVNGNFKKYL